MGESGNSQRDDARKQARRRESGLAGLVDFVRSVPSRLRRPESMLMLLAMLASLGAHMPPWVGLGALRDYFERIEREKAKHAPLPPAEVTFEVDEAPKPKEPEPVLPEKQEKEKEKPREEKLAEPEKPKPEPEKVVELKPEPKPAELELTPPPEQQQRRKQSITQKSDDPNVEAPPDAKYLAEENRRVEEETVASVTDEHHNDPEPNAAAPQGAGPEESGDSHKDEKGADKGSDKSEDKKIAAIERTPQPQLPSQPPPPTPQPQENRPARPAVREIAPKPELPSPTVVQDPMGSFVLAPASPGQAARKGQDAVAASNAQKIKVSWSAFEATFGAEPLAQDRLPKQARRRGAGREKRWEEFRAAIENYIVGAKPGNTTALNAAADPFAAYLAAFHRNLHQEFAHEFLASLPALGELADTRLVTKVEIVVNSDGSLDRVGVVKSSGNMMYDFGAFNAVQRGAPYPAPPEKIRSPDGRVYIVWALRRDESQCGTWNAEPYILKTPPRSPNDPKPDNVSPYRPSAPGRDPPDAEHGRAPARVPEGAPKVVRINAAGRARPRAG